MAINGRNYDWEDINVMLPNGISVGITEIATTGTDTNSIFTEPSDTKFLIVVGKAWPTASALAAFHSVYPARLPTEPYQAHPSS